LLAKTVAQKSGDNVMPSLSPAHPPEAAVGAAGDVCASDRAPVANNNPAATRMATFIGDFPTKLARKFIPGAS
jgi:hypothetical protein